MWLTRNKEKENETVRETRDEAVEQSEPIRNEELSRLTPNVDIYEKDDVIYLAVDMPGVDKGAVELTLEKNVLTIEGRSSYSRPEGYGCSYAEFRPGVYRRSFTLNQEIDRENIEANLKDGVLTVVLKRLLPSKTKIEVH